MKNLRKKSAAVLAGLAITGLVGASAASLGGVDSDNLGADVGVVASCDTDGVTVAFETGYDDGVTTVTDVTIGGISVTCVGQAISVTLADGTTALTTVTGTVLTPIASFEITDTVDAEEVTRAAISISG